METDARFCFFFLLLFNQNYNRSLECDCLSPAQFEHQQDNVCIMLVIGWCNLRIIMLCLCKRTVCFICAHCSVVMHFAKLTAFFFYENV